MTKFVTILSAAAIAALGAMPVALGPLSLGDAAFAQGPPSWAGKGLGAGARALGRGGPPAGIPGIGGGDFGRGGPPAGVPGIGGGVGSAGSHYCPPGLMDKECFPPGAQKFLSDFCPRGLEIATAGCIPPGLHVFRSGDVIPRHIGFERIFHRDLGLPAPTRGHHYARIDRDVYLVSEGTRQVVRAIGLLGATGY